MIEVEVVLTKVGHYNVTGKPGLVQRDLKRGPTPETFAVINEVRSPLS
jgi:hypothetical protein